jgi:MFS family permease
VVTSPPAAALRQPVAAAFAVFGVFWGTWAVAVADVQRTFHLSYATVGVLLAVAIGIAGVTGAVMGHFAERWGTRRMLSRSLLVWSVLLVAAGTAPWFALFALAFVATEVAGGVVDTAMNAAASIRLVGQPGALVRLHALFNTGALLGAAAAALALHAGVSWRWLWPTLSLGGLAVALWTATSTGPLVRPLADDGGALVTVGPDDGAPLGPLARLRRDRLLFFLVIFALAEIAEGGVDTWGVLFLRNQLGAGVILGAGGYVVGQAVAATTRGAGGPLLGRLSARSALAVGGLMAAGGITLEAFSPHALVAAGGLAVGAGGASLFWPLVMSEVTNRASKATAAIGAFTAAGYVGWVAGAPVVGWVADTFGLKWGLVVLATLAGLVATAALLGPTRSRAALPE